MSDLISREEAIEAIEEYADRLQMVNWKENPNVPYKVHSLNWCINMIRDMPSIDAVKHGKWIKMSDADGMYYCCSECGEELYRSWSFDREFDIFPHKKSIEKTMYCSNCGARMDGEKNETN